MAGGTTISFVDDGRARGVEGAGLAPALVIAWSASEPERVGQVAFLASRSTSVLGRGEPQGSERDEEWLWFHEQRPGTLARTGPLTGPGISRRQVRMRTRDDALVVENVGRCPMLVGGEAAGDKTVLTCGDTLLLRGQLLLLFTMREATLAPLRDFPADAMAAFGDCDALGFVGESPAAWRLREQVAFAAQAPAHVLLSGESGTGKELAARAVHELSARARGPFVARNAATFPATLIDAELFGNAKNYPNAGAAERPGLVGQADGGTLFLDEIGELPADLQAHLLRVLDARGEYQRLGEAASRRSDFRLVAATNRDPEVLKHDFLARLALRLEVPPLVQRREDVPLLLRHLFGRLLESAPAIARRFATAGGAGRFDALLVDHLLRCPLPANVRDLEALLWTAMSSSAGGELALTPAVKSAERTPAAPVTDSEPPPRAEEPTVEAIRAAVDRHRGNLTKAARSLGLSSRYALYRLLRKHSIEVDALRS